MGLTRLIFKPFGCLLYALGALAVLAALGIAVGLWALHAYGDRLLRAAFEVKTDYALTYDSAEFSLWRGDFEAKNVRVFNPARVAQPVLLLAPRIFIDADPLSLLFSKTVLVHEVALDIDELCLCLNADGTSNLSDFLSAWQWSPPNLAFVPVPRPAETAPPAVSQEQPAPAPNAAASPALPAPAKTAPPPAAPPAWRIAKFTLSVRRVRVFAGDTPILDAPIRAVYTFAHVTDLSEPFATVRADFLRRLFATQPAANTAAP